MSLTSWATNGGSEVSEPSSARKAQGYDTGNAPPAGEFNWLIKQLAQVASEAALTSEAVGSLAACIGYDMDAIPILSDREITTIRLTCPDTPASGTIEVELFVVTPGGAVTSLYPTNPLPTLTCNGGYASATSANLPDTTSLTAGDLLICRITDAPSGAYGLKVQVS